jgi:TonB family protein
MQHQWLALGLMASAMVMGEMGTQAVAGTVVPIKLVRPVYPQIAEAARVRGVVIVYISVQPDGQLAATKVAQPVPLLQDAAVQAAKASTFECRDCTETSVPYTLVYSFELSWRDDEAIRVNAEREQRTPFQSRIRIAAPPRLVMPYFASMSSRSVNCLYLWRCGTHWGGEDYYYYRDYSATCLWLWQCGRRRRHD